MNCTREGCTGTIIDGYCDTCGIVWAGAGVAGTAARGGAIPHVSQ